MSGICFFSQQGVFTVARYVKVCVKLHWARSAFFYNIPSQKVFISVYHCSDPTVSISQELIYPAANNIDFIQQKI